MLAQMNQAVKVGSYIFKQRLKGHKRYPLVLMLEPLYQCNLACAGCGKIQHPDDIMAKRLTVEQCVEAVKECGAPVVSIAGGEPLMHRDIGKIVEAILAMGKVIYLCSNGMLFEKRIDLFKPSASLFFSFHVDGLKKRHDEVTCKEGVFDTVVNAIRLAKSRGFNVTTNTTIFDGEKPEEVADLFDFLMDLGVNAMMISPGYSYQTAPNQDLFLERSKISGLFREIFEYRKKRNKKWRFNHSPYFIDFLLGEKQYECSAWGNPNYSPRGWQRPCYLLDDSHVVSFDQLMNDTKWEDYGVGKNAKCGNCMVHCGYEPTAVSETMSNPVHMVNSALKMLRPY